MSASLNTEALRTELQQWRKHLMSTTITVELPHRPIRVVLDDAIAALDQQAAAPLTDEKLAAWAAEHAHETLSRPGWFALSMPALRALVAAAQQAATRGPAEPHHEAPHRLHREGKAMAQVKPPAAKAGDALPPPPRELDDLADALEAKWADGAWLAPGFDVHRAKVLVRAASAALAARGAQGAEVDTPAAPPAAQAGDAPTVDAMMEQAQVFASAWALVGGRFDSGDAMEQAEAAKAELRNMLAAALAEGPAAPKGGAA